MYPGLKKRPSRSWPGILMNDMFLRNDMQAEKVKAAGYIIPAAFKVFFVYLNIIRVATDCLSDKILLTIFNFIQGNFE